MLIVSQGWDYTFFICILLPTALNPQGVDASVSLKEGSWDWDISYLLKHLTSTWTLRYLWA